MARIREFEPEEALDDIMNVFWRQGYEGSSLHDIERAAGLNKQSLYRLYKDKRAMYLAALRHYEEKQIAAARSLLEAGGSAHQRFERLFNMIVSEARKGDRRGCFLCNASTDQAQLDDETKAFVTAAFAKVENMFCDALKASPEYDNDREACKKMAAKLLAGYFGLRVLVKASLPVSKLKSIADDLVAEL